MKNLNLFKNLSDSILHNKTIKNFVNDLEESINKSNNETEIGILEQIQKKSNTSIMTKNGLKKKLDNILINFSKENGDMYFIIDKSSEKSNTYVVYKYENGKDSIINIQKKELPQDACVNSVLRLENNEYIVDKQATEKVMNKIINMANELIKKQNQELKEYRKENHLYMVTEKINNSVFLLDITDRPDYELEEVDFPKELLTKASEGTVFKYINGEYKFYSNDGFERIEK